MRHPVCIDVGANYGQELEFFLVQGYTVYAFEPIPKLCEHLKENFKKYEGYRPVPLAVDIENRWVQFKESNRAACSSIYEFTPNIANLWQTVADDNQGKIEQRTDFVTVDRYPVMTIRLDTFMTAYNIDKVDYLWIDAQGNDFNVLRSCGNRIKDIVAGQCEAALNLDLYSNTDNKTEDIVNWLLQQGFSNCEIKPHDHKNEAEIFFKRIT